MSERSSKSILMIGCFDTKGEEFNFLRQCLMEHGSTVLSINTGIMGTTDRFLVDIESEQVARQAGVSLTALRSKGDRGEAVKVMGLGAAGMVVKLLAEGKISAIIGMGGGGGTYIALAAMQQLPIGIPKLCLSTMATKDLSRQIGTKDITLMPTIVDVAGLNPLSRLMMRQAAAAICGMSNLGNSNDTNTTACIAISMFGNTTACVDKCRALLEEQGYQVLVFHANGAGGRTMESLIREGYFCAVLDMTTTELADELCQGVCSAGPDRLSAAGELGIPQVVVPGCLDMVNFAHRASLPKEYENRKLYQWTPEVTLMRTNIDENRVLGELLSHKVNRSKGKVSVLLPMEGLSQVDIAGGLFYDQEANRVLFDAILENCHEKIQVMEIKAHINEEAFAVQAVRELVRLLAGQTTCNGMDTIHELNK